VVFAFTVSDGTVVCSLDGAAFAACTSPFGRNLPAGSHQFAIRATDAATNATTVTRAFTVACAAPVADGAAGLLHLDDTGQVLANAVVGGAPATLGDTAAVEPGDPTPLAAARFGGASPSLQRRATTWAWPIALPAMPELTIELWLGRPPRQERATSWSVAMAAWRCASPLAPTTRSTSRSRSPRARAVRPGR